MLTEGKSKDLVSDFVLSLAVTDGLLDDSAELDSKNVRYSGRKRVFPCKRIELRLSKLVPV